MQQACKVLFKNSQSLGKYCRETLGVKFFTSHCIMHFFERIKFKQINYERTKFVKNVPIGNCPSVAE